MVKYAVWYGRMKSPIVLVVAYFVVALGMTFEYERFMLLSHQYIQRHCWSVVSPEDAVRAKMLFMRSGVFCLDSFSISATRWYSPLYITCDSFSISD